MQSTTASNSRLTPEQQLDVLWKALQDHRAWICVDTAGRLVRSEAQSGPTISAVGAVMQCFSGSRESCIAQLLALQVADRLDGVDDRGRATVPDVYDDLGPNSCF